MIFTTFNEVKPFIAANISNEFATIEPYLNDAVSMVIPFLSQSQWDKLVEDYEDDITTDEHTALLERVQRALVQFAYLFYTSDGAVQIDDMGFTRLESGERKSAYQWMVIDFRRERYQSAWRAISDLVKFLDTNPADYTEWATSEERTYLKGFFLWNYTLFTQYRQVYTMGTIWDLRSIMADIQDELLLPVLGQDFYDELKAENLDSDFSADNKLLLPNLCRAIAHFTVARGIDEGLFTLTNEGISTALQMDTYKMEPVAPEKMSMYKANAEKKGNQALKQLKDYLQANASASKYAAYFTSDAYTAAQETPVFTNDSDKKIFFAV